MQPNCIIFYPQFYVLIVVIIHITIVHTMGSHIVRTLKALNLYICWPEDGRNAVETSSQKTFKCISTYNCVFYYIIVVSDVRYIHFEQTLGVSEYETHQTRSHFHYSCFSTKNNVKMAARLM